jgi:hypothetical protein
MPDGSAEKALKRLSCLLAFVLLARRSASEPNLRAGALYLQKNRADTEGSTVEETGRQCR